MTQIRWWPAALTLLLALGLSAASAQESCPANSKSSKSPKCCCCEKESGCCAKCDETCHPENKSAKNGSDCCAQKTIKVRVQLRDGVEDDPISDCDACERIMCQGAGEGWPEIGTPVEIAFFHFFTPPGKPAPEGTELPKAKGDLFFKAAPMPNGMTVFGVNGQAGVFGPAPITLDFGMPFPPMPPSMNFVWHGDVNFKKHAKAGGAHGGCEAVCPCEQCLQKKISVNFDGTPLRQVIDELRVMTGTNVLADEPAFEEAEISFERPVTLKLDNVTFKSVLNLLTHQLRMGWTCRDEVLMLTTAEHCRGKLMSKTYTVEDLVHPLYATGKRHAAFEDLLIRLVTNTIAPATWSSVGGRGTIDYYPLGMALVVTQTPDVHEQVAELLAMLRQLRGPHAVALPPPMIAPAPVPMPPAMVHVIPPPVAAYTFRKEPPPGTGFGLGVNSDGGLVGSVVLNERNFGCQPSPVPAQVLSKVKTPSCVPLACPTPMCSSATNPRNKILGPDIVRVVHRDEKEPLAKSKTDWLVVVGKTNCLEAKGDTIRICKGDTPVELHSPYFTVHADCLCWSPDKRCFVLEGHVTFELESGRQTPSRESEFGRNAASCDRLAIYLTDTSITTEASTN